MGKFKPINSVPELSEFCKEDKDNVGVTRSGDLYTFDFEKNKSQKLSLEEAGQRLGLSNDIMTEVVKSGGHFEVPTPIVVEKKEENHESNQDETDPGEVKEVKPGNEEDETDPSEVKEVKPGNEETHMEEETEKKVMKIQVELSEKFLKEFQEMFEALKLSLDESFKQIKEELKETKEKLEKTSNELEELQKQILL